MDDQSQSLDALLQLNQDFSVPDQLFDDSEIGVTNVYNTVEIETSDTGGGYENEVMVKDDDHVMVSTELAANTSVHEPSPLVQVPDVTTSSSLCKLDGLSSSTIVHQKDDAKQGIVTTKPTETHSGQPMPLVTQTSANHAPLKMVSVPVNSDVITQGNSQVVLIPVGGMDSSKLEGNLKVPLGQKLVIIKPQEILKTIEEQKSHKEENPAVVGVSVDQARNIALTQHGIVLQGSHQGGFQHIPLSNVGKLVAAPSAQVPAKKGLVNLAPKGGPMSPSIQRTNRCNPFQQGLTTNVPRCAMVATVQQQLHKTGIVGQAPSPSSNLTERPQVMASQVAQHFRQAGQVNRGQKVVAIDQVLRKTLQNAAAGSVVITTPKVPANAVGIVEPVGQTKISNLSPSAQPQQTPSQLSTPSDEVNGKSTDPTTSQTSSTTSQTSSTTSQTSFTTSKTSSTTSQTSSTTSQTCLTTSQTSLTTSQPTSTTAGIEKASTSSDKPNLYKTLKENQAKLVKGSSVCSKNSAGSISQVKSVNKEVKSTMDVQSNVQPSDNQKAQTVVPVCKTPSQKIVVTYVSPTGKISQKVDDSRSTSDRSGDIIQVPAKVVVGEQNRSSPGPSGKILNATNISVPKPSSGGTVSSGQQPKMVPRILPQVRDIKTENSEKHVDLPSASSIPSIVSPSSAKQPKRSPIEECEIITTNVSKRGRPRKNQQSVTTTQNVKKTSSGPTLKHELDRQRPGSLGRLKAARSSEHQMKALKYKRVSSTNPWTCALCGKVSFADSLGCLYGPYDESSDVAKEGGGIGEGSEPQVKRRRGSSLSEDGSPRKTGTSRDLWFHGDCIVWSPGVYVLGESLVGYMQVVSDAQSRKCDYCACCGATLVCLQRACKKQFHFSCAKTTGCVFEESNYTIQCGKHMK